MTRWAWLKNPFGLFSETSQTPAPAADVVREAKGVTVNEDEGWRKLTGDARRDLDPLTQSRMQELAVFLWKTNGLANRLIELPLVYMLAEGVQIRVPDEEAQSWVDQFWRDPINNMDIKLPKKVREMALFGEQCWPVFANEITGHVRLGYLDPSVIATVVTDPENVEQPIGVITRSDGRGRQRKYRVIINGPEEVFGETARNIRETFTDGECFFFTINDLSTASRGQSDLLALMDWLDALDKAMFGELERWDLLRSFIWDVTLKGATPEEVEAKARNIQVPRAGGIRVHNDSEEWNAVTPDLKSVDGQSFARMFRNWILGGRTIPEHWFGGGGDVNRSTGESMGEPTFKDFSFRQTTWKHILEMVTGYVIYRRLQAIGLADKLALDPEFQPQAIFPELTTRDTTAYAAALQQVVVATGLAIDKGLLTEETAVTVIAAVAGRLGVEVNPVEELEKAKAAAEKKAEQDLFPPDDDPEPVVEDAAE